MNFLIKNFHHKKFVLTLALIFALAIQPVFSYNMRQSSNIDGLSNSAILSLCRDDNGFLWIGTCDGVNIADGTSINPFTSIFPGQPLSGNIIEAIFNGGNGIMCVLTNHGLDIVDCNKRTVSTFPQFGGQELMCVNEAGTLFLLAEDSGVFYHDPKTSSNFVKAGKIDIPFDRVRRITMKNNSLWIVSDSGIYSYDIATTSQGAKTLSGKMRPVNKTEILFAKIHG